MSEVNITLKGWKSVLALVVVIGLAGFRFMTFQDRTADNNLMRDLEIQILSDCIPKESARLQAAMDSGETDRISETTQSFIGAKPKIESVQISSPLLVFSTSQDVVVKVVYSLSEGSLTRDRKTLYYLYRHGAIGNTWSLRHKTTALNYYLNFK